MRYLFVVVFIIISIIVIILTVKKTSTQNSTRYGIFWSGDILHTHSLDSQSTRHRKSSTIALMVFHTYFVVSIENKIYSLSLLNILVTSICALPHNFCLILFHLHHLPFTKHTHTTIYLNDSLLLVTPFVSVVCVLFSTFYFLPIHSCITKKYKTCAVKHFDIC